MSELYSALATVKIQWPNCKSAELPTFQFSLAWEFSNGGWWRGRLGCLSPTYLPSCAVSSTSVLHARSR